MNNPSSRTSEINPNLRNKLIKESLTPWLGLRRTVWIALFGSASFGLIIMSFKVFNGDPFIVKDFLIQLGAFFLFASLLWIDRSRVKLISSQDEVDSEM